MSPRFNPYPIGVKWEPKNGVFAASFAGLPNLVTYGIDPVEAVSSLCEIADDWLKTADETGYTLPEPKP